MNIFKIMAGVVFMGVVSGIYAQTSEHRHEDVEEVLVTSTPLGDAVGEVAQPVSVLSGDALLDKQAGTIGETLAAELGVTSSDFGQAVGRPVIRGMIGPRVRVLEASIGTMDLSTVSADHAVAVESFFARQIEVLRGPATLLYGSGAVGGVVNVVDNRIPVNHESFMGKAEVSVNTVSAARTGMFELNTLADNGFAWHLDALSRQSDDYKIPGFAVRETGSQTAARAGVVENSDVDLSSAASGISYTAGSVFLGLAVSRIENNYGLPGGEHQHDHLTSQSMGVAEESGPRLDMQQTRIDFKGRIEDPFSGFSQISLRGGFNDYQHTELEPSGEIGTRFNNDEMESRLELVHAAVQDWQGVMGLQYNLRKFSAIGDEAFVPPVDSKGMGVFVVEHKHMQNWNLELGTRLESQEYVPPDGMANKNFSVASYSVGAIWHLTKAYSLSMSWAHSERAPATEELFSRGPHRVTRTYERGNAQLEKETASSVDGGLRYQTESLNWRVNLFRNRMGRYIFLQSADQNMDGVADWVDEQGNLIAGMDGLLLVDYQQGGARFSGVEAEIEFGLLHTAEQKLGLRLFADAVKGELNSGRPLPRMTPVRRGVELSYAYKSWRYGLDIMRVAKQTRVAAFESLSAGYTAVNADFSYTMPWSQGRLDLFVKATNLTDAEIRRHTSFLKDQAPLPGRNLQAGVRVYF